MRMKKIEYGIDKIPDAIWNGSEPNKAEPVKQEESEPLKPDQFAAYQAYRLANPNASLDDALLALMEQGVIKLRGNSNPSAIASLKKEFGNKQSRATGSTENQLIALYMEANNCSMETAILSLAEQGKIKI